MLCNGLPASALTVGHQLRGNRPIWKTFLECWEQRQTPIIDRLSNHGKGPNSLQRQQFFTNFTVEALVPRLAVAVVATNAVFAKSSVCTRQCLTRVAVCRTKKDKMCRVPKIYLVFLVVLTTQNKCLTNVFGPEFILQKIKISE